jgi:hypothetical protein
MADCKHTSLEFLGSQKTDLGTNNYLRCKTCGEVLVVTADNRVFGVKGVGGPAGESGAKSPRG